MTTPRAKLREMLKTEMPLDAIVNELRRMKISSVSRAEVENALISLRGDASGDAEEDRILEVLDVVTGFCSPHDKVW